MSDKKGISAFLKKNQKKGAQNNIQAQVKIQDDEVLTSQIKDSLFQNKDQKVESSDEEEDDAELNTAVKYGNIKEKKDVVPTEIEENKRQGYGFLNEESKTNSQITSQQEDKKQKKTGEIQFGAKPSFGRKKQTGKFAGDFDEGLDDIDDDGNLKKKDKNKKPQNTSELQREFVNLGSSSKGPKDQSAIQDNQIEIKKEAVKPTFKGKLNLKQDQSENENSGVAKNYDFNVIYKKEKPAEQDIGENQGRHGEREKKEFNKEGNYNKNKIGQTHQNQKSYKDDEDEWNKVEEKQRKRNPRSIQYNK